MLGLPWRRLHSAMCLHEEEQHAGGLANLAGAGKSLASHVVLAMHEGPSQRTLVNHRARQLPTRRLAELWLLYIALGFVFFPQRRPRHA